MKKHSQKHTNAQINLERFCHLRYDGTDFPLMISEFDVKPFGVRDDAAAWAKCFTSRQILTKNNGIHYRFCAYQHYKVGVLQKCTIEY